MGLNETRVGLAPPPWLHALARLNLSNARTADWMVQVGHLCETPEEALKYGFLDHIEDSEEGAEEHAIAQLKRLADIPWNARVSAKLGARKELLQLLDGDLLETVDCIVGDEFQTVATALMASLKKK
ncbi:hypothetical protein BDR26DRAFT_868362 [Obelidium mucronatum]|nr:hypothetical protein BDR26DRAFT_868362 [Obelidium mucronatum]